MYSQDTVKFNLFSKHDNRHTLESWGDHLGGPYGKKHIDFARNQHSTGNENIKWDNTKSQFRSTYTSNYGRRNYRRDQKRLGSAVSSASPQSGDWSGGLPVPAVDKTILDRFYPVPTKERFTRFPKKYDLPKDSNLARPSVNSSWWSSNTKSPPSSKRHISPPLSVLGASQLPHLGKNTWKYSYKL